VYDGHPADQEEGHGLADVVGGWVRAGHADESADVVANESDYHKRGGLSEDEGH